VKVVPPFGEMPWKELSRLSDDEMKILMIDAINQCYKFLSELFVSAKGGNHRGAENNRQLERE
jgi:hypothetical protein